MYARRVHTRNLALAAPPPWLMRGAHALSRLVNAVS